MAWWKHSGRVALLLVLFGAVNIIATYTQLSHTADESPHFTTGMQWWDRHEYNYEPLHPPLARLMGASIPYFSGITLPKYSGWGNYWNTGNNMFYSNGKYLQNLFMVRLGMLPFYLLSCALVYHWSRKLFGDQAALASLGLYVTLPTLAAHAGLLTTDMGGAAMLMAGIMASLRWLKKPDLFNSILAGATLGAMVAAKFSAAFYWPVSMFLMAVLNQLAAPEARAFTITKKHFLWAGVVALECFLILGSFYFFSFNELIQGFEDVLNKNKRGHATFLFHKLYNQGVWYFFPVLYLFKTPLAFLLANLVSMVLVVSDRKISVEILFPLVAALAVFAIGMPSNINIGLRHALSVYPLLAVPAGYGMLWLWRKNKALKVLAALLIAFQLYDFMRFFPDRIQYYNQAALAYSGDRPEKIAYDSDLDWGQEYLLLAKAIKKHEIKELYGCFWYGGFLRRMNVTLGLQPMDCPAERVKGWIAVGAAKLQEDRNLHWLEQYEPVDKVGYTIRLYHID